MERMSVGGGCEDGAAATPPAWRPHGIVCHRGARASYGPRQRHPHPVLHGIIPPDRDARLERLRVTVESLKAAFGTPGVTPGFAGRRSLLVAGTGDRTLRLAAAEADGFIIASVPPVPRVELPPGPARAARTGGRRRVPRPAAPPRGGPGRAAGGRYRRVGHRDR